jgi:hypothetical protein
MATIHPSRLGLVPTPPEQPRRPERQRSNSRGRDEDSRGRANWGRRDHDSADDREPTRQRSRSREPRGNGQRRASPAYDNYERAPAPAAPWRQEGNMYPPRDSGHRGGGWSHGGGGGGGDFAERYVLARGLTGVLLIFSPSRRQQRLASNLSIWPPSPKHPEREE